jgi:hypothetical protein
MIASTTSLALSLSYERTFTIMSMISGIIVGNLWKIFSTILAAIASSYA